MFFNFVPAGTNHNQQPQHRHPNQPNVPPNQRGIFGGFNDFLFNGFMNPFFRPNEPEQEEEMPRPTFSRMNSKKQEDQPRKAKEVFSENTGMYWKEKANEKFKAQLYEQALEYYSKAIQLNDTESVFFSNRARCLKIMGKYEEALKDAQEAIELDSNNIKAHLLSGQILALLGKQSKDKRRVKNSIVRLTKALTLCSGQKKNEDFQHEISSYIYKAKKLIWYLEFEELREKRIKAINEYKLYLEKDQNLQPEEKQAKLVEFMDANNEPIVFQIPDYLICRITLELMEDPVITDSGHVYERSAIQEHIQRNGKTDPFTRKPISGNLYPCVPIKKGINDFLEKNPWAYEYCEGETYNDLAF